jgi:hypothetical protein
MIITFKEALDACGEQPRSILLGNGFSIAQAGAQFSYASLLERSGIDGNDPIRKTFSALETFDFEEVMHSLQHAAVVETAYGDTKKALKFRADADSLREALLRAIRSVHPGAKFEIPAAQIECCATFLDNFQSIFTTNYDLLLYWVILQRTKIHSDGFGHGTEVDGFRTFQASAKCNTYFLHGALHLFLGRHRETKKRVVTGATIIDDIELTIRKGGQLPLFVAEGQWHQKLSKINSVAYLRRGYQKLKEISGNMFVLGHSVAANDKHIYGALFSSRIEQLFFCVRDADRLADYQERLAPFSVMKPDLEIFYVDATSARVWR